MSQKESEWDIAQIARERVKNEAFYKDIDTGQNCIDLTKTREIIQEAIANREKEIAEEVKKFMPADREVNYHSSYSEGKIDMAEKVLQIIKH